MLDATTSGVWQKDTLLLYYTSERIGQNDLGMYASYRPITVDAKLGYFGTD